MRRTSVGHSSHNTLAGFQQGFQKDLSLAEDQSKQDYLDSNFVRDRYKDVNNHFIVGLEELNGSDGHIPEVEDAVSEAQRLEDEAAMLEAQLRQLRGDAGAAAAEAAAAAKMGDRKAAYAAIAEQLSEVRGYTSLSQAVFKSVLARPLEDIRDERVSAADIRFVTAPVWSTKEAIIEKALQEATDKAHGQNIYMAACEEEARQLQETRKMQEAAERHLNKAFEMRRERDVKLHSFYEECSRLTEWCRQQLANLEAMEQPDHVQEYCATLVENYDTMSKNYAVLLRNVEPYVQANLVPVHQALLEAEEVWFFLQISTLEKLSTTLFEIHPKSPLDVEVAKYATYSSQVASFLRRLQAFIHGEGETEDGGEAIAQRCEELLPTISGSYTNLGDGIANFSKRAEAMRMGYKCFRDAILSRITYVNPLKNIVADSRRRQEEYESCVKELQTWAAEASYGESWRDIYSKIVEIKKLIKKEQGELAEQEA